MPTTPTHGSFEECTDELNDLFNTLERYPPTMLAFALRAHLSALLQALQINALWTHNEVITFMEDMQQEALELDAEYDPPASPS